MNEVVEIKITLDDAKGILAICDGVFESLKDPAFLEKIGYLDGEGDLFLASAMNSLKNAVDNATASAKQEAI